MPCLYIKPGPVGHGAADGVSPAIVSGLSGRLTQDAEVIEEI